MHIWFNVATVLSSLWQNSLHFAGFALMAALVYPLRKNPYAAWQILDMLLGLLAAGSALYLIAMEDAIYARGVRMLPIEWIAGIILILCALEFTRRVAGWFIPVLIIIALSYVGWWGGKISGVFKFAGLSPETILFRSIYGDDALFGTIASISSSYVFMFILFGAFLLRSGAGEFVIDLARAVAGQDGRRPRPGCRHGLRSDGNHLRFCGCQHRLDRRHHHPADETCRLPGQVCRRG